MILLTYQSTVIFTGARVEIGMKDAIINYMNELRISYKEEPAEVSDILPEYDFIVVGAGSAGCVVANRLTEVDTWNVLLIEAGGRGNHLMDIPGVAPYLLFTDYNWNYKAEPSNVCKDMINGRCAVHKGKVMGGSSAINFMMYNRGNKHNYNEWEEMGNPGWGWKDVLPLFMKIENMTIPDLAQDTEYHSTTGEMPISYSPFKTPLVESFLQAGNEMGFNTIDVNSESQNGFGYVQSTTFNGSRITASKAFLHPIRDRKNLHIKKRSYVTKILIDPITKVAYGVEFMHNNNKFMVRASKEVIVSAGAVNSPQLLMLSGIGPTNHLLEFNIPVIQNLDVGYNLMDHPGLPTIFMIDKPLSLRGQDVYTRFNPYMEYFTHRQGPLATVGGVEAYAFLDSKNLHNSNGDVDIEFTFIGAGIQNVLYLYKSFGFNEHYNNAYLKPAEGKHSWTLIPLIVRPKSRGRVYLKSSNPFDKPAIYHDFYEHPEDIKTQIRAINLMLELTNTSAFQKVGTKLYDVPVPGCEHLPFSSDAYWECAVRHASFCIYHISGTCKMGPSYDQTAVVDSRLRVHGIKNLRVIDASIMPTIPAGHINGPTMMIGENGAKFVKEDWGRISN
ncbi:Glucose dehydrogenase [FAD, quinone] [Blattella germanica]|nr:Glucose dehydrogenase [FAD, quinone] [Blattella germanica]